MNVIALSSTIRRIELPFHKFQNGAVPHLQTVNEIYDKINNACLCKYFNDFFLVHVGLKARDGYIKKKPASVEYLIKKFDGSRNTL